MILCCNNSTDSVDNKSTTCVDYIDFNQSVQQAGYFLLNVTIGGVPIGPEDGVAAYKGNVCVGYRQWDTSLCNSNICEIIAMGDDGSANTDGYCSSGDILTFKIYDVSEKIIYDTIVKDAEGNIMEIPAWTSNSLDNIINNLEAVSSLAINCD